MAPNRLCTLHKDRPGDDPASGGLIAIGLGLAEQLERVLGAPRVDPLLVAKNAEAVEHGIAVHAQAPGGRCDPTVGSSHGEEGIPPGLIRSVPGVRDSVR